MLRDAKFYSFALLLLIPFAWAQQTPEATPTFTARSELVLVPVMVRDKSGAHVAGLKKEDFTLLDEGVQQPLAAFDEIQTSAALLHKASTPGVFSNAPTSEQSHDRRLTIILLDLLNPNWADQAYGRQQLVKYLSTSLDAHEPIALLTLRRSGLKVIHDFSRDPQVLITALKRVRGQAEAVEAPDEATQNQVDDLAASAETADLAQMIQESTESMTVEQRRMVGAITRDALRDIAHAFAAVPGRKSLIWISSNLPGMLTDPRSIANAPDSSLLRDAEETWHALDEAAIAVYPVDAGGLVGMTPQMMRSAPVSRGRGGRSDMSGIYGGMGALGSQTIDNMRRVAEVTGGKAYVNTNDLAAAMRDAEKDSASYYLLAFRPAAGGKKNGDKPIWHKLTVKVNAPHTAVHARSAYLYSPPASDAVAEMKREMQEAISSPLEYTALPVQVRWAATIAGSGPEKRIEYEVSFVPAMDPDTNRFDVDVMTFPLTGDAKSLPPLEQTISGKPKPETASRIRASGILYKNHLSLAPGEYSVKVLVHDRVSGEIGTVVAPLKVD